MTRLRRTIPGSVTPWLIASALLMSFTFISAHVGLTFPPARKFDLDFLDNIRTKPPCGMPKGTIKTSLVSGSSFNVTWHLSYPHRGGYRLELMDSQERALLDLTPKNGNESFIKGNPTAQHHEVKLPKDFTCEDCTIRLLRQASEWANNYRFWSCSDVDIVPSKKYRETCGGHGRAIAGRCVCNKGFWGHRCQYEDECDSESECGGNGKCIDLGGTALPRKQCFCNPGFHGEKCRKRNAVKLPFAGQALDLSRHTKRELSDRMNLYYKIIPAAQEEKKEIEFILEITGTSYGAVGWRPAGFNKTCQRWPFIQESEEVKQARSARIEQAGSEPHPEAEAEPKSESEPETEPESTDHHKNHKNHKKEHAHAEPESSAEPESAAEPTSGGKHKKGKNISGHSHKNAHDDDHAHAEPESAAAEPESNAEPESEPEGTAEPETSTPDSVSSASKLKSKLREHKLPSGTDVRVETSSIAVVRSSRPRQKRSPKGEDAQSEPEPESEPESAAGEPEPESGASEPEPKAEGEPEPEGEPHAEAEAEPGSDKHDHHPSASSKSNPRQELIPSEWAPKLNDFHAMDCIDLVMGAAKGTHSRIRDYYTRDRSTPRLDTFWGGKEDITSATGWEQDGKTILIFRRRIRSTDAADHDLVGDMHVIWARGQEPGEYNHSPKSGLERENPHKPNFYAADEIKYHGHGGQRGKTRIDFLSEQVTGRKKVVKGACDDSWAHPPGCSNQDSTKPCTYNATWQYIPEIDSVRFTIETRRADRWTGIGFSDDTGMRQSDAIIGWVQPSGQFFMMDTFMTSYNIPPLDASQDISNMTGKYSDGIVRLSFLRKVVTGDHKDLSLDECRFFLFPTQGGTYHAVNKRIGAHEGTPIASAQKVCIPRQCTPARIKRPSEIRYNFDIKLTGGFGSSWSAPAKDSEDFNRLGNRIETDLSSKLKDIPGFGRLHLNGIKKEGEGAIANLELMVTPNTELADQKRVERALKETIQTGKVGNLQLDPTFLQLQAPEVINEEDNEIATKAQFGGKRLWIVLGCVAALILLAIVQAILTIYKTSGKTTSHKGSPSSGSGMAWRDYSETNYGYDAYDEKNYPNAMPMTATSQMNYTNSGYNTYQAGNGNGNGYNGGHHPTTNMSLPRPQHQLSNQQHHHSSRHNGHGGSSAMGAGNGIGRGGGGDVGGGGGGGAAGANPDFYFMPSQRKYSGEVVRVYVDHNKR